VKMKVEEIRALAEALLGAMGHSHSVSYQKQVIPKPVMQHEKPHQHEPDIQTVRGVRCLTCKGYTTWSDYLFNGASPKSFCRCADGKEDIVKCELEVDAGRRVKGPLVRMEGHP
jgi:hypothetical protein